ncbi:putative chromate transport protein [Pigmentiphaga humi]|uniref:Putative chromate transport protein n=1 Tax=Pigmentiphaga humi TaxID=2478468 RepID=A0A3P4B6S7_9BURK|nr:chromate transporter [Pigmentiphaga humi]VCU71226.1 putative chromate transport protein [Pigmentiphaga humi]
MNLQKLLDVVLVFLPLSFLTVGGGQSIVADIHRQSVEVYGWMTNGQFMDLFALSRILPGPGALLVTLVGWQAAGLAGALLASAAIFIPSSLLVFALAHVWTRYKNTLCIRAIEAGLVPVAAGMVLAASCTVLRAAEGGAWAWGVAAASTLILMFTRISPLLMLGVGAGVFLVAL